MPSTVTHSSRRCFWRATKMVTGCRCADQHRSQFRKCVNAKYTLTFLLHTMLFYYTTTVSPIASEYIYTNLDSEKWRGHRCAPKVLPLGIHIPFYCNYYVFGLRLPLEIPLLLVEIEYCISPTKIDEISQKNNILLKFFHSQNRLLEKFPYPDISKCPREHY